MLKKLKLNGFMKTYKSFRTNTQKRCPFHYRGLECKSRKSSNTWSNRQIWPWSTEWSRAKANRVLPRECTGQSKHPFPTTQEISVVTSKFGLGVQKEAGQRLTEFCQECTGHSKHPLPTTQDKTLHMDITRWSIPKSDCLYFLQPKMEKLYTVSKNKTMNWLWLRSWTPYCQIQT